MEPQPAPVRKGRGASAPDGRRRGALLGALLFIGLALAGVGWFFKDQVRSYWDLVSDRFQKTETPDAAGASPEVAALLKTAKSPTGPAATVEKPAVASKDTKDSKALPSTEPVAPKDSPKGVSQAPTIEKAPAPVPAKPPGETVSAVPGADVSVMPPPVPPPVETTRRPEIPVAVTREASKEAAPSAPEVSSDPPAMKALPVDSGGEPLKSPKGALPETLVPTPPVPRAPDVPALVEVPAAGKGAPISPSSGDDKPVFIKASAEAKPAAETLNKFFRAKTWQDRLVLTQPQEKVRPLMERYYAVNPDGPVRVSSIELIRHEKTPEIGTPLCVFQVSGPDLTEPLPVMVEASPDGWKVDWLTFTEFKDKLLLRYLQKWQDEPARFHVMARRTHYFDEDVPNLDKKHCFELMPPTPGYSGYAFVPKGTPLAQNLDRTIGWEVANLAAVVELRWRKQDRYQWVEITAVPQLNWRSTLPAIPVAQPANPVPESHDDTMLAKPASSSKPPAVAEKK
jgi:hypothetical protein